MKLKKGSVRLAGRGGRGPARAGADGRPRAARTSRPPPTPSASALPETTELNIYGWSGEIPESIIKDFETETGVTVTFDTFDSNESMVTKLQSGATGYDLVNPSQYAVQQLAGLKLIQELDHSMLPSLGNVPESFQQAEYDPGNRWSVPVMWGTTAMAYNTKYINDDLDSWAALTDPKYKGKIMMLDNMLAAYIPALQANGYDAGSTVKAEVDVATQWLMDQKPLLQGYNATNNAQLLAQGQVWVELAWNSQIVAAHEGQSGDQVRPAEGRLLLLDRQPVDHAAAPRTSRTPTSSSSTCCSPRSRPRCAPSPASPCPTRR